jgi:glycerol kinase
MELRAGIMAIDQGTTSSRAIVFAHDGRMLGAAQEPFPQHYPQPGWVEHDPEDIWASQVRCCRRALERAGMDAADLAAIGIANQRETILLWDAKTGASLGNAIVWQCRRTAERCAELERAGFGERVTAITGLRLDPYFSATKLEWLLANRAGARDLLRRGRLRAGTIDAFLAWRLTDGRAHATDYGNASRTMLLDLQRLNWSDEMLQLFGIPSAILPQLTPSSGLVATTEPGLLGAPVPIAAIAGDQQAALFGQGALEAGESKNTYGTGCFLLVNTGDRPAVAANGLLSTIGWVLEAQPGAAPPETGGPARRQVRYALEGSVFTAGAAVQWLRDGLGIITEAAEIGPLAAEEPDSGDVYFVPALTGLGAPYWDPEARGTLVGLTRGTAKAHIARATEEAICFQTAAVLDAMGCTAGVSIEALRVDGGAAGDDFLLQLQADLTGIPMVRPRIRETTGLGAAALAGLAVGFWSAGEVAALAGVDRVFEPHMSADERATRRARWEQAVERARGWAPE